MPRFDLSKAVAHYYYEESRRAVGPGVPPTEESMAGRAQPLQYDESGFPVPTTPAALGERLRRLLAG